jgi:hypothetical protein
MALAPIGEAASETTKEDAVASATELGTAGLQGWRAKVGDAVAGPVSKRTPLDSDQVRAAVGALFFVLATLYVVRTVREAAQRARG